jgi:hypothetical protein
LTGVLGGAGLSAPFVWGALGRLGSRVLQACLVFFFFSTLTRYPRLFADVSSQFFSYGESPPCPSIPVSLGIVLWEPGAEKLSETSGFPARFPSRHPLPFALIPPSRPFLFSFALFHPYIECFATTPAPAGPCRARRLSPQLLSKASFSPRSSLFPCVFTCSRGVLNI